MRNEVSADFECVVALEGTTSALAHSSGDTGERLPAMRVAAALLMMCVTACGTGPIQSYGSCTRRRSLMPRQSWLAWTERGSEPHSWLRSRMTPIR